MSDQNTPRDAKISEERRRVAKLVQDSKRQELIERNEYNFMSGPLGPLFRTLADKVVVRTRPGRDQSLAITHLEDALFRANAAMHRG